MSLMPGTVVSVNLGLITHLGIVSENATVISASRKSGMVVEQVPHDFSEGNPISVIGYLGELSPLEVIERAREKIGEPYDLFRNNCEHFVTWVHGLEVRSPQVAKALIAASVIAFAFFLSRK